MNAAGRFALLVVWLVATCSGCEFANSKFPVVMPSEAKPSPKLHGAYRVVKKDEEPVYVHLGPAGTGYPPGFLRVVVVGHSPKPNTELTYLPYICFVRPLGNDYLINIPLAKKLEGERLFDWTKKWASDDDAGAYQIAKLVARPDGFDFVALDNDFLAAEIAAGRLSGDVTRDKNSKFLKVVLNSSTEDLARYFTEHQDDKKLFAPSDGKFIRLVDPAPAKKE